MRHLKLFSTLIIIVFALTYGCREQSVKAPQDPTPNPPLPEPYGGTEITADGKECQQKLQSLKARFHIQDRNRTSNGFYLSVFVLGKLIPEGCLSAFQNPDDLK